MSETKYLGKVVKNIISYAKTGMTDKQDSMSSIPSTDVRSMFKSAQNNTLPIKVKILYDNEPKAEVACSLNKIDSNSVATLVDNGVSDDTGSVIWDSPEAVSELSPTDNFAVAYSIDDVEVSVPIDFPEDATSTEVEVNNTSITKGEIVKVTTDGTIINPKHTCNMVNDICTVCGKKSTDPYELAPEGANGSWNYTLDDTNNIITLNYYTGSEENVIVYGNYQINGKSYKTQLSSNSSGLISDKYMFNGYAQSNCKNIKSIIFSKNIDTSNVTNMGYMFDFCSALESLDLSSFDTSKVTIMFNMFSGCTKLTSLDLSNWDTSKVTTMQNMFDGCSNLISLDLSNFNTSKVTTMRQMFRACKSLSIVDISGFDTSKVTDMSYMFQNCQSLEIIDLTNFDTSKVTNMSYMFNSCTSLTLINLSSFKTQNVNDSMFRMFSGCTSLTSLDLSSFDTSNVTDMREMFYYSQALKTIYVSRNKWSTAKAQTTNMFKTCGTSAVTYVD